MKNTPETLAKRTALKKHWRDTIDPSTVAPSVKKVCNSCHEVKDCHWMKSFTQTGIPEYRAKCNDCQNAYLRRMAKASRTKMTTQALDRKMINKLKCVTYLGGACASCGYSKCPKAMTFHHREPADKGFTISTKLDYSWAILQPELDKCELLCFNCHMEHHCEDDSETRTALGHPLAAACSHE